MSCPAADRCGGIGPDTAVTLLITVGDNPERLDSEESFAALCGVSPVARSSGLRQYRRLNRGGAVRPMPRCIASCSPGCGSTGEPRTITSAGSRRVSPAAKSSVDSSAMRAGRSSTSSDS
ncbi:transposase [Streptomyces umbrinus]|uniref:transposase n=1 Tax=Streptomyces umbrinus TaxID=67370 RepID=UPI0033F84E53